MEEVIARAPCWEQSEDKIRRWLRAHVELGADVVVRTTREGRLRYDRGRVVHLGKGRFDVALLSPSAVLEVSGAFYYSGRSCRSTRGNVRLVIPTLEVIEACAVSELYGDFLLGPRGLWICSFR